MKRLVVVLGGLLALPAFAEVAPFFYDGVAEYADAEMTDADVVAGDEIVAEEDAISAPVELFSWKISLDLMKNIPLEPHI